MVVGTTVVAATKNTDDDAYLAKISKIKGLGAILKVAQSFSPIQKTVKTEKPVE